VKASSLSTIKLPGGASQVTYAGHPLYLYSGDSGPGETDYVGVSAFGGDWDAINAAGHAVK
jgi:predicted lipoprotein with Yx(FWY)xxD motif